MVKNKIIVPLLANAILLTACETAETITLKYIDDKGLHFNVNNSEDLYFIDHNTAKEHDIQERAEHLKERESEKSEQV